MSHRSSASPGDAAGAGAAEAPLLRPRGVGPDRRGWLPQVKQHELPREQAKVLARQGLVKVAAKRHQLSLDALDARDRAQRLEYVRQQVAGERQLRMSGGHIQSAEQPLVLFQNVKRVSHGAAILDRGASRERFRVHEFFDQLERRAIVPVQFFAPMLRLFREQRFDLAGGELA